MSLIRFATKVTVIGGIAYYSYTEGLWSKSEDTAKLYETLYINIAPYIKENVPKEVIQEYARLPSIGTLSNCTRKYWNKGVMTTMEFIADLPTHTTNGVTSLYQTAEKYMKELS